PRLSTAAEFPNKPDQWLSLPCGYKMTHAFCESWARFAGSSFFARLEKLPPHTRPALRLLYCFTGLRERSCAWRDSLIPSQFGSGEFMHDANPSTLDLQANAK